ncbi:MAG: hypothetical protein QOF63_4282 [Thermoanaerobaculia bacterium]|nr:hypothetical protein [Thermoanaerobaculia bacterium]
MRKTLTLFTAVLLVFALAACGGSSKKSSSSSSSGSDSSSSASGAASGDFCKAFQTLDKNGNGLGDLTSTKDAAKVLEKLDPPSEISNDWKVFLDYLKAIDGLDQNNAGDVQKALSEYTKNAESLTKVFTYVGTSCLAASSSDLSDLSKLSSLSNLSDLSSLSSLSDLSSSN